MAAILDFSGFCFRVIFVIGVSFCIDLPNFVKILLPVGGVITSYRFFRDGGPAAAILNLTWITLDHPRNAIVGLRLVIKCGFYRIFSFGDIAIFTFCRFG